MVTRIREIAKEGGEEIFLSDDEFAFASGQLIRYLLNQSKTSQRNHSMLEPFLQKVDPVHFKNAVANAFNTYKHEVYNGLSKRVEFDKLMNIAMGYDPDKSNMKDHLPMILAGYFAETVFPPTR